MISIFDAVERGSHHFMSRRRFDTLAAKSLTLRASVVPPDIQSRKDRLKKIHKCIDRVVANHVKENPNNLLISELNVRINSDNSISNAIDEYNAMCYTQHNKLPKYYPTEKYNFLNIELQDFISAIIKTRNNYLIIHFRSIFGNNYDYCKYLLKYIPDMAKTQHYMAIWQSEISMPFATVACAEYIVKNANNKLFTEICTFMHDRDEYENDLFVAAREQFAYEKIDIFVAIFKDRLIKNSSYAILRDVLDIKNATLVRRIFNGLGVFNAKHAARLAGLNEVSIDSDRFEKTARIKILIRAFPVKKS
jgi:hypothetical protein